MSPFRRRFADFRGSRWYRRSLGFGAAYLVYALLGFFVVPPVLKSKLIARLGPLTHRRVAVREVRCNPLALSLTIRGLALTEPDGAAFASWEELYVNFELSSLFRFAWTFDTIRLADPEGHLLVARDGRLNVANLVPTNAPSSSPSPPAANASLPRIQVHRLYITNGIVVVDDLTHRIPLHSEFKPINLALTNLTTRIGRDSLYSFNASGDSGRRFAWEGTLVAQPFQSRGHFELSGGDVTRWTPLVRDFARLDIAQGTLRVEADYAIRLGTNGLDATVTNGLVELDSLQARDLNTGELVTTVAALKVNPFDFDLRERRLHAGNIRLDGYTKLIRIETNGTLNLHLLIEPPDPSNPPKTATPASSVSAGSPAAPFTISVDDFRLSDGAFTFADLSRHSPFQTVLKPVTLAVTRFSNRVGTEAGYEFKAITEAGETLAARGTFGVSPIHANGTVTLDGLELRKYHPYFENQFRGEVLSGKVDAEASYALSLTSNPPSIEISKGRAGLSGLAIKGPDTDSEPVLTVPMFGIEGIAANLAQRRAQVDRVASSNVVIRARRETNGTINLSALVPPTTNSASAAPPSARLGEPWRAQVNELALAGWTLHFDDQSLPRPATQVIADLSVRLRGLSTETNAPVQIAVTARMNASGHVGIEGTCTLQPLTGDLAVNVGQFDLPALQPYLDQLLRLSLMGGRLEEQGRLHFEAAPGKMRLKYRGGLAIEDFATRDRTFQHDLVGWDRFEIAGIEFDTEPTRLEVGEVRWRGLNATVMVAPDQRVNLLTIAPERSPDAGSPGAPGTRTPSAAMPVHLQRFLLEDAGLRFTDESIEPHVDMKLTGLRGSVKDLEFQPDHRATIELSGSIEASGRFQVTGTANPLAPDLALDLGIALTNTDLTPLSPYFEKFGGHPLNKGKLALALQYQIERRQLKAANRFLIDRLTLGPRNDSTNATSLPVKLAVALLKDRNGLIDLDVPVSGSVDDPEFRLAPAITKVIINLVIKAATSPFSLLGALVGGGGEELSYIDFAAGSAEIPATEMPKLDKLIKALTERPALGLEIAGGFDTNDDRVAVARVKLDRELMRRHLAANPAWVATNLTGLPPAERTQCLLTLFAALGTNESLRLPDPPTSTNQTAPVLPNPTATGATTNQSRRASSQPKPAKGAELLAARPASTRSNLPRPAQAIAPATTVLSPEQIETRLIAAIEVSDDERRELATRRAQAVQEYLLKNGTIEADRLFLTAARPGGPGQDRNRVTMTLN